MKYYKIQQEEIGKHVPYTGEIAVSRDFLRMRMLDLLYKDFKFIIKIHLKIKVNSV